MTDTAPTEPTTPEADKYYLPLPVLMGRVLADVPAVGKNSQAPANMGGYAFRGIEDVLAALKPAMARHGVFCIPDVIERLPTERTLQGGKVMFVVDLCIRWTFYGPAGDTLTSTCWGQGTDMGDKATQKAMTSAFKSMLMQTFVIGDAASDAEAHDVPETHRDSSPPPPKTDGWESAEQEAQAHKDIGHRLARLPEDHPFRIAGRVMREKHGWPVALERLAELRNLLDDAERAPSPPQSDEKPTSPPEPSDTPDAPSLPLPEPETPTNPEDAEMSRKAAIVAHVNNMTPAVLTDYLELRAMDIEGTPKARKERLAKALVAEGWEPF